MLDRRVKDFLHRHGVRLNTDLGQHFLIDDVILQTIIETADLKDTDHVVEIGPGIGILTAALLTVARHVTAIEIDGCMIPLLKIYTAANQKPETKNQKPSQADALTIVHMNALQARMPIDEPYKVVANIPYHITSPLLRHLLLESERRASSMTLLLQRDVAENICDERSASILTILVRLFGTPRFVVRVPPASFLPPPAVDSAVLRIDCSLKPLVPKRTVDAILRLAKHAMSQRRKMLRSSIGTLPGGAEALGSASIDASRRPETLTVQEWIALERALSQ